MDDLKQPVSDEAPFGSYLKEDRSAYRALRNAFNGGQTAYRALTETSDSMLNRDLQAANVDAWSKLEEEARAVLCGKSKDIEVFSWYLASCVQLNNPLSNLLNGLEALTAFVETDWDRLHPIPPEKKLRAEDEAGRKKEVDTLKLRIFLQLVGEVPNSGLLHLPLTNLPLIGEVTYGDFIVGEKEGTLASLRDKAGEAVDGDDLRRTVETLQGLQAVAQRLDAALRGVAASCDATPVPVSYLIKHISEMLRMLRVLTEGSNFSWPGTEEAEAPSAEAGTVEEEAPSHKTAKMSAASGPVVGGGSVPAANPQNRKAALDAVRQLARYFRETEPHSPIHLLLERAVRWGHMSAADLYVELLGENSDGLAKVTLMTGLESQAYSDKRGKAAGARVEMPTVNDYGTAPVPETAPAPAPEAPAQSPAAGEAESSQELPLRNFEW